MEECALIKLVPQTSHSIEDTLLIRVQTAFNASSAHNKRITTVLLYEDRLYYADTKGVMYPIETEKTRNVRHNNQAEYLKNSITSEYRLANTEELKWIHTITAGLKHLPLPDKIIDSIMEYLTPKEQLSLKLSEVVHTPSPFFPSRQQTLINRLIEFTLQGNQIKVEQLLKRHPVYAAAKGTASDFSGRVFHNVSAFECALWARDWYMYHMMLDYLPCTNHGEQTRLVLLEQYTNLASKGLIYTLKGKIINETHYNLQPLIAALQEYMNQYRVWDWNQREAYWCTVVGLIQRHATAFVAQHYCNPNVGFCPLPAFNEKTFTRSLTIDNWINSKRHSWFVDWEESCRLGFDYGIFRGLRRGLLCGRRGLVSAAGWAWDDESVKLDLAAVTALRTVSEEHHLQFKQNLEIPRQILNDEREPHCVIS